MNVQMLLSSLATGLVLSISIFVAPAMPQTISGSVVSVGDGDTLSVRIGQDAVTVRLACIDSPELAQAPYGAIAANRLKELLPVGREVMLNIAAKDQYGRMVATVFVEGMAINYALVAEGHAVVYRQYLRSCPALAPSLVAAETNAREMRVGFWSVTNSVMPWDFRRAASFGSTQVNQVRLSSPRPGNSSNFRVNWRNAQQDIDSGRYSVRIIDAGGGRSYGGFTGGGGGCNVPSDRAADGSRCGGRAASQRPGGR
jgi:micrococcal nuclease